MSRVDEWRSVPLKYVAGINERSVSETTDPTFEFDYIDIGTVGHGRLVEEPETVTFENAPSRARRVVRCGDTIVSTVRTYLRAVLPINASVDTANTIVSTGFAVVSPRTPLDGRYFGWVAQSDPFIEEVVARSEGVSYPAINATDLGRFSVRLPPPANQRAIADFLDAETARIDGLIAKKRRLAVLLDEAESAVVDAIFGARGAQPTVRLARAAKLQTGLTLDAARDPGPSAVTLPYLRVANVQAGHLDLGEVKEVTVPGDLAQRCRLRSGDVLMTEGGDLDKLGRGTVWRGDLPDCLHQNHVFAVRPDRTRLLPDYLAMITRTSAARRYFESTGTRSTNLASTNCSKVLDLRIPLVPVEEQRSRLDRYEKRAESIRQCRRSLDRQIDVLREHRQALITAAVTGDLDVPGVAA